MKFRRSPEATRQTLATKRLASAASKGLESLEARIQFDSTVVFNEINYRPPGVNSDSLEWVELHNQMGVDVDLSAWRISSGIDYTFPEGTIIKAGKELVIASNPAALAANGYSGALGGFTGQLSNSGERLNLKDRNGRLMDTINYDTKGDWPVAPDGSGATLAKINPDLASDKAANWAASNVLKGTPGAVNFPTGVVAPKFVFNEIKSGADGFVEIYNPSSSAQVSLNYQIKRSGTADSTFTISQVTIPGKGYVSFTAAQLGFGTIDPTDKLFLIPTPTASSAPIDAVAAPATLKARSPDGSGRWLLPSVATPGAANQFLLRDEIVINEVMYKHQPQQPSSGSSQTFNPVLYNSTGWKFNQSGTDLGTSWLAAGYDDSAWTTGQGVFSNAPVGGAQGQQTVTTLFSTGLNPAGTGNGTAGATDSHWTVSAPGSSTFSPAFIQTPHPAWAPNSTSSGWIGITATGTDGVPGGDYVYRTTFSLDGFNPTATTLNMTMWADNAIKDVRINGVSTGISGGDFNVPASRSLSTGFVSGTNTIEFVMTNFDTNPNPGGFRATLSATSTGVATNTQLALGPKTYYFRKAFDFAGDPAKTTLNLGTYFDDGAVVYLNGVEVYRQNMPGGAPTYNTSSQIAVGSPGFLTPATITLPAGALKVGANVLEVEVHQAAGDTADVAMGIQATFTQTTPAIPFADSTEEWIELYNKSDHAVDLTNWKLNDAVDYKFVAGTTLGSGQYLVIAKNKLALAAKYPSITIVGNYSGGLSGSDDNIELLDPNGNPADAVHYYDAKPWPHAANGEGSSLELRDPNADNSKPEAWAASSEAPKSGWKTYTYSGTASTPSGDPEQWQEFVLGLLDTGEVLLDDIVVKDVTTGQAQILQNGTFENGTTSSWRIIGNHHGSVVLDPANANNHVLDLVATGATEHMHNHAETTLAGGLSIVNGHSYEISYKAKWVTGSPLLNTRLWFNRVARTTLIDTPQANGTPGAQNSTFVANAGPTFDGLKQDVVLPAANQAVVISVNVADNNGLAASSPVVLKYSVNGGAFATVTMTAAAGTNTYSGTIPGQAASAIVQFYVQATDALGATANYPAAGPASRALYKVNDGVAQNTVTGGHTIRIVMTAADTAFLHTSTNVMSNEDMGATVIYDNGEVFYDVGVALHSSERGRDDANRVGFNLDFNADHLFRGVQSAITIDKSNITGGVGAETLLRQALNHAGGLPSNYNDAVKVIAPQSSNTGFAILQQGTYGNDYLDSAFDNGSDGNVYKLELIYYPTTTTGGAEGLKYPQPDGVVGLDFGNYGTDKERYRNHFILSNNRDADDFTPVMTLGNTMGLSGTALEAAAKQTLDVDEWMRMFALQSLGMVSDTYGAGYEHNFKVYQRPSDQKMMAMQWDWDFAFNQGATTGLFPGSRIGTLTQVPTFKHLFYGHLQDMIATTFNTSYMGYWTNHYATAFNDTGGAYGTDLSLIGQRASFVTGQLPPSVAYGITSATNQTVNTPTVTLSGKGWVNVKNIFVRGSTTPLDLTWSGTNVDTWTAAVPVYSGANHLVLDAYNFQGVLIGTQTIDVTSTANLPNLPANLRVTELNFNPAPVPSGGPFTDQDFEFIEFKNFGTTTLNLKDATFTSGINFTFGNVSLAPGQVGVVVANAQAFQSRYGTGIAILGEYGANPGTPNFDNGGETVTLVDSTGQGVVNFTYDDDAAAGWYAGTDGFGPTLEVINPSAAANLSDPTSWRPSPHDNGTPGADDTIAPPAPTGQASRSRVGDQVTVTWDAVRGAASYSVYRSTTLGNQGAVPIATNLTGTSFTDLTAVGGRTYYYKVTATTFGGEGPRSPETATYSHVPGDATDDLTVDFNDLIPLAQNYNDVSGVRTWADGDFTGDGNVDFNDLIIMAQNYNTTRTPPSGGAPVASAPIANAAPMPSIDAVLAEVNAKPAPKPTPTPAPAPKPTPVVTKPVVKPAPKPAPKPIAKPAPKPAPAPPAKVVAKPIIAKPVVVAKMAAAPAVPPTASVFSTQKIASARKLSDLLA